MKNKIPKSMKSRRSRISMKYGGSDIILIYRLITERALYVEHLPKEAYSLSITKISSGGKAREVEYIRDITSDPATANRIFDLISRGCVTPCTAREIVSELIGT